jgi:DNA-directed RNA polymerase specialized sigma24 family protein
MDNQRRGGPRARARDGDAFFADVFREHHAAVYAAVQRFGVPSRDAEDLTQRVFLVPPVRSLIRVRRPGLRSV